MSLILASLAPAAHAGQGLSMPEAEVWWPHWQARISLATVAAASSSVAASTPWHATLASYPPRAALGAAVLGDLTLASPSFGSFRASGGLLVGGYRALPSAGAATLPLSAKISLATPSYGSGLAEVSDVSGTGSGAAMSAVMPYLGVGFSSAWWQDSLAFSADMGWVSERPSAAGAAGRALFGNQGFDGAVREMRLSPVLQLSVRYRF